MDPFDAAWSILKGDFILGGQDYDLGNFAADYTGPEYEGTPYETALPPLQRFERYDPSNMHLGTKRMMVPQSMTNISEGQMSPRVTRVVDNVPTQQPYFRGSSVPSVRDGGLAAVNVASVLADKKVSNFDDFARLVGSTAAHEEVHRLIEPEIHEWSVQQTGVKNHDPEDFEHSLPANRAFLTLNSLGHEKGAFALTPGMTQKEKDKFLRRRYAFSPYLNPIGRERLINELHLARSPMPPDSTLTLDELREAIAARMRQQQ